MFSAAAVIQVLGGHTWTLQYWQTCFFRDLTFCSAHRLPQAQKMLRTALTGTSVLT
jgi:hypothetical protein